MIEYRVTLYGRESESQERCRREGRSILRAFYYEREITLPFVPRPGLKLSFPTFSKKHNYVNVTVEEAIWDVEDQQFRCHLAQDRSSNECELDELIDYGRFLEESGFKVDMRWLEKEATRSRMNQATPGPVFRPKPSSKSGHGHKLVSR